MSKEIRTEKNEQCTIYSVGISDKFRIVQNSDDEFVIEKLYKETETKGYLFWKKTYTLNKWKKVCTKGYKRYNSGYSLQTFKTYKTLEKAIKWIEDYNKYPIYH